MSKCDGIANVMSELFGHKSEKFEISQRVSDGWIDATKMCKTVEGKLIANWKKNKSTHAYLKALAKQEGLNEHELVVSTSGHGGSTWIHPEAAIHLALWVSPELGCFVTSLMRRFFAGDMTLVKDLVSNSDAIRGTTTLVTMTATKDSDENLGLAQAHAVCASSHAEEYSKRRKLDHSSIEDVSCIYSTVERDPHTDVTYVRSEWMQRTIDLDAIWNAIEGSGTDDDGVRSVYFLREIFTNRVKVGFTKNLIQRMRTHQCGNAGDLVLEFQLETSNYREVEACIKKYLTHSGLHIRGEWFFLNAVCDYKRIVETASKHHP